MALVFPGVTCAICAQPIDSEQDYFATSGVVFPPGDPLYRFCDAPLHWDCYEPWTDRPRFADGYFRARVVGFSMNPYWSLVLETGRVAVGVNPNPPVEEISVLLAETGSGLHVPLARSDDWLRSSSTTSPGTGTLTQRAVSEVLPVLRAALPDRQAILDRIDHGAKQALFHAAKDRARGEDEDRLRRPRVHNRACRMVLRDGPVCPNCGAIEGIRFLDRSPQAKSWFVCASCGRSFGPSEALQAVLQSPWEPDE